MYRKYFLNFSMCIYFVTLILWSRWWYNICIIVANTDLWNFRNERNNDSNKLHLFGKWYRFGYLVFCHRLPQYLRVLVDWHTHTHAPTQTSSQSLHLNPIRLWFHNNNIYFNKITMSWHRSPKMYLAIHGNGCDCIALIK